MTSQIWNNPAIVEWSQLLLSSFHHWTKRELLERVGNPDYQAHALFHSPFVVVSHVNDTVLPTVRRKRHRCICLKCLKTIREQRQLTNIDG